MADIKEIEMKTGETTFENDLQTVMKLMI